MRGRGWRRTAGNRRSAGRRGGRRGRPSQRRTAHRCRCGNGRRRAVTGQAPVAARNGMDLFTQQLFDLVGVARDVFEILRQEVHGPGVQRIEGHARAFVGQRREHQDRCRAALHDVPHRRDAVHHRHFVVHGDHVGLERQRLINCFLAIGGGADHFNRRVSRQNFRHTTAEKPRIVHHQDLDYHKHSVRRQGTLARPATRIKYAARRSA